MNLVYSTVLFSAINLLAFSSDASGQTTELEPTVQVRSPSISSVIDDEVTSFVVARKGVPASAHDKIIERLIAYADKKKKSWETLNAKDTDAKNVIDRKDIEDWIFKHVFDVATSSEFISATQNLQRIKNDLAKIGVDLKPSERIDILDTMLKSLTEAKTSVGAILSMIDPTKNGDEEKTTPTSKTPLPAKQLLDTNWHIDGKAYVELLTMLGSLPDTADGKLNELLEQDFNKSFETEFEAKVSKYKAQLKSVSVAFNSQLDAALEQVTKELYVIAATAPSSVAQIASDQLLASSIRSKNRFATCYFTHLIQQRQDLVVESINNGRFPNGTEDNKFDLPEFGLVLTGIIAANPGNKSIECDLLSYLNEVLVTKSFALTIATGSELEKKELFKSFDSLLEYLGGGPLSADFQNRLTEPSKCQVFAGAVPRISLPPYQVSQLNKSRELIRKQFVAEIAKSVTAGKPSPEQIDPVKVPKPAGAGA